MFSIANKNIHNSKLVIIFSSFLMLGFSLNASAKEPLNIQSVTITKDKAAVNDKVRAECRLIEKTSKYLVVYGKKHFSPVTTESTAVKDAYNLEVTIIGTVGGAGGAWTGRKGASIKGTVKKNGKLVGSFEAFRSSGGRRWGFGGGFAGTCSLLGRSVKRLSRDIAEWARTPTPDSRLGELK